MITYSYKCDDCGKVFDKAYRFCQQPTTELCPDCGGVSPRFLGRGSITNQIHYHGWDWSRKNMLDPASDDPRLDPGYFDDLMEDTDRGPKSYFQPGSSKEE